MNEQSDLIHAQQRIFGIRVVVICIALYFQSSFPANPHTTWLHSQPPLGMLVTCPSKHSRDQSHNES